MLHVDSIFIVRTKVYTPKCIEFARLFFNLFILCSTNVTSNCYHPPINVKKHVCVSSGPPIRPACNQVYNLFHPFEPLAARIEPLILSQFSQISSVRVPRYQKFPRGDGVSNDVMAVISGRPQLFHEKMMKSSKMKVQRTCSNLSSCSTMSLDQLDFSVSDDVKEGE